MVFFGVFEEKSACSGVSSVKLHKESRGINRRRRKIVLKYKFHLAHRRKGQGIFLTKFWNLDSKFLITGG